MRLRVTAIPDEFAICNEQPSEPIATEQASEDGKLQIANCKLQIQGERERLRRLHVELLHCRGGAAGTIAVELGDETNPLRLVSELADPAPALAINA